ncbi:metal-dependent hydrolase [Methanocalculus sp.]|uniref:metal-dependent hydrolase n=1 Tax=Methanocalculus sp. TaxID=2004547 RepID=UPI002720CA57|nr:metal-dependent hydrolase [Methanocalculus sp.]MDO8842587.1 metal-dependent hydrolase [Methanocalculus sp.]
MKGSEHLVLSLLSGGVFVIPFISSFEACLLVFTGLFIGSLAPDADAKRSAIFRRGKDPLSFSLVTYLFGLTIRYLIYYPVSLLLMAIYGRRCTPRHRGLLHSLAGLAIMSVFICIFLLLGVDLLEMEYTDQILLFSGAFLFGALIHLLADTCTVSGIGWLFPLSERRWCGTIKTGDKTDIRSLMFASTLGLAVLFLLIKPAYLIIPEELYQYFGILILALLWSLFFLAARVR